MSETGLTPMLGAAKLGEMGFSIALFPTSLLRLAAMGATRLLADLKITGDTANHLDDIMSLDDMNSLLGLDTLNAFEDSIAAGEKA